MTKAVEQEIKLVEVSDTYIQEGDCCEGGDQFLKVFTQDGGSGQYIVIETELWAIDPDRLDDFLIMIRNALNGVEEVND